MKVWYLNTYGWESESVYSSYEKAVEGATKVCETYNLSSPTVLKKSSEHTQIITAMPMAPDTLETWDIIAYELDKTNFPV